MRPLLPQVLAKIKSKESKTLYINLYFEHENVVILISIVEIVTVSPRGLTKSSLEQIPGTLSWKVTVLWTPDNFQIGPHIFCFHAIDNFG